MKFLLLLAALPAFSQITVTVSDGPRTARRSFTSNPMPRGVAVRSVQVCGPAGSRVSSGEIIQHAARSNATLFAPGSVDWLAVRRSTAAILVDVAEGVSLGGAFVTGGDLVKLHDDERKKVTVSLVAFSGLMHWAASKIKPADPTGTAARMRALELPSEVTVPTGGCWQGTALGR